MAMQNWFQQLFANLSPTLGSSTGRRAAAAPGQQADVRAMALQRAGVQNPSGRQPPVDIRALQAGWEAAGRPDYGFAFDPNTNTMTMNGSGAGMMQPRPAQKQSTGGRSYGGASGGFAGAGKPMPGLPPYMQPPANWQQMLPGGSPLPPLFGVPNARNFGIGNYRTPDYAGLLGQFGR